MSKLLKITRGIVQLNGFVNPQQAFIRAVELVRTVKRVKSVKNDIIVK